MICKLVASAFVLADFYPPPCFVKFIGYVWASPAAFRVGPVGQMEGNWFHLCASALFHACAEGLAVADEFHVPQSFRLAAAIAPRRREKSARHQFSPLGKASCVPHPVTVDNHSAIHLYEQTLLQGHAGHFRYRGGRKRCPPPTASTLTGASDGDCQKKVNCRTAFRLAAAIASRRRKKPVRRQFRPLGEAVCALKPVQPSWITELVPGDY